MGAQHDCHILGLDQPCASVLYILVDHAVLPRHGGHDSLRVGAYIVQSHEL